MPYRSHIFFIPTHSQTLFFFPTKHTPLLYFPLLHLHNPIYKPHTLSMLQNSFLQTFKTDRKQPLPRINISQALCPQHLQVSHRNLKNKIKSISRHTVTFKTNFQRQFREMRMGKLSSKMKNHQHDEYGWQENKHGEREQSIRDLRQMIEQIGKRREDSSGEKKVGICSGSSRCSIMEFLREDQRRSDGRLQGVLERGWQIVLRKQVIGFKEFTSCVGKLHNLISLLTKKQHQLLRHHQSQFLKHLKPNPLSKLKLKLTIKLKMILQLLVNRGRRQCWKSFIFCDQQARAVRRLEEIILGLRIRQLGEGFRRVRERKVESFEEFVRVAEREMEKRNRAVVLMMRIGIKSRRMDLVRGFHRFHLHTLRITTTTN